MLMYLSKLVSHLDSSRLRMVMIYQGVMPEVGTINWKRATLSYFATTGFKIMTQCP